MDSDLIVSIIIWVVVIAAGIFSSKKDKEKQAQKQQRQPQQPQRRPQQRVPQQPRQRVQPQQRRTPVSRPAPSVDSRWALLDALLREEDDEVESKPKKEAPVPQKAEALKKAEAPKKAEPVLPEEGVRATTRKSAPMAPNPKEKPWLAQGDNLKNALIYGELLAPKF